MESISNNQIKYIRSLQQKKVRDAEGVLVAEGRKAVNELLPVFSAVAIVATEEATQQLQIPDSCCVPLLNASDEQIARMSSLRTPQGVIAVFKRPRQEVEDACAGELTVALDGVQDPGNLGTIIRTCDWFGVKQIVCSHDTADCFNPKVVQATMGALGRVKVVYTDLASWLSCQSLPIYGTLLEGASMYSEPLCGEGIVVMGNEGNGLSGEVREMITRPLFIPPYPADGETVESLNVAIATAVVLAEFRRPKKQV